MKVTLVSPAIRAFAMFFLRCVVGGWLGERSRSWIWVAGRRMGKGFVDPFCERRCIGLSARETITRAYSAYAKRSLSRWLQPGLFGRAHVENDEKGTNRSAISDLRGKDTRLVFLYVKGSHRANFLRTLQPLSCLWLNVAWGDRAFAPSNYGRRHCQSTGASRKPLYSSEQALLRRYHSYCAVASEGFHES